MTQSEWEKDLAKVTKVEDMSRDELIARWREINPYAHSEAIKFASTQYLRSTLKYRTHVAITGRRKEKMQIKIVNDADGCPAISVIDKTGATINSLELAHSEEVTIEVEGAVATGEVTEVPATSS